MLCGGFSFQSGTEIRKIMIGNVHLESLDNRKYRRRQLKACSELLSPLRNFALLGDFNFDSSRNFQDAAGALENLSIAEYFPHAHDVWPLLHERDEGFTFDSVRNANISRPSGYRCVCV